MNNKIQVMVETAIMIALAFIIEIVFTSIPGMPQGGRISLSMLPIIVLSWRRGIVPGVIAGVLFSGLNMLLDGFSPAAWGITYKAFLASMFLDYLLAFGLVGMAGLGKKLFGDTLIGFGFGIFIAATSRFVMHVLSGAIIFSEYAGDQNPWLYSIIYNGTYMLPTFILLLVVGIGVYLPLKSFQQNTELN